MGEEHGLSKAHIQDVRSMCWRMGVYFAVAVIVGVLGLLSGLYGSGLGWVLFGFAWGFVVASLTYAFGAMLVCMACHAGCYVRMVEAFLGYRALEEAVWLVIHKDVAKILDRRPDAVERRFIVKHAVLGMLDETLPLTPRKEHLDGLARIVGCDPREQASTAAEEATS